MKHLTIVLSVLVIALIIGCGGQKPAAAPKPDSTAACCDSATLAKCQAGQCDSATLAKCRAAGCDSAMLAKCGTGACGGGCDSAKRALCHGDSAAKGCGNCPGKTVPPATQAPTGR